MALKLMTDEQRFLTHVSVDGEGCWIWTASCFASGYGQFYTGSRTDSSTRNRRAHKWAYEHFVGPVPEGMVLGHKCERRNCVNPEHVRPVTQSANVREGRLPAIVAERNRRAA